MRNVHSRLSIGIFVLSVSTVLSGGSQAGCGNRPGTPNEPEVYPISANQLDFRWRNTTNKGANKSNSIGRGDQPYTSFFDIYVRNAANQSVGADVTGGARKDNLVYGERSQYVIGGLAPNTRYCVSLRSRSEARTEGCVSEVASLPVCATTLNPGENRLAPLFNPYRPSSLAPAAQAAFPIIPPAQCAVRAEVHVGQCRNLTGEPSEYFSPVTLSGCGKAKEDAFAFAAASGGMCLGSQPGCCQYTVDYSAGPAAAK